MRRIVKERPKWRWSILVPIGPEGKSSGRHLVVQSGVGEKGDIINLSWRVPCTKHVDGWTTLANITMNIERARVLSDALAIAVCYNTAGNAHALGCKTISGDGWLTGDDPSLNDFAIDQASDAVCSGYCAVVGGMNGGSDLGILAESCPDECRVSGTSAFAEGVSHPTPVTPQGVQPVCRSVRNEPIQADRGSPPKVEPG